MFSKILVPLDGRDEAAIALKPALAIARATRASIRLVTVLDVDANPLERAGATAILEHAAAGLGAAGAEADTVVRTGAPAVEILAAANEAGADLIAMATHARSGLSRMFLGSVTEKVLSSSPVPVLLLRPGGHELSGLRTILVPVDGSPGGSLALASAVALGSAAGARIVLLQVVVPMLAYQAMDATGYGGGGALYLDPAWDDEALEAAKRYTAGLADRLRSSGARADGMAVKGGPLAQSSVVEAIIDAADQIEADLIVMSTHAHTGARRLLLGSTADALVRNSHRPVLMVRRGAGVETETAADSAPAASSSS